MRHLNGWVLLAGDAFDSLKATVRPSSEDNGLRIVSWCGSGNVDDDPSSLAIRLPENVHLPCWRKKAHVGIHIEPTLTYVEGLLAMNTSDYQRPEGNEKKLKQQGHCAPYLLLPTA